MSSESGSGDSIDDIINILEHCTEIAKLKEDIKSNLNAGIFCMTMARNSGCSVSSFNCRFDLTASAHVVISENSEFELFERKPDKDPLLLICALPPPAMKHAQKNFKDALKSAIDAANMIWKINRALTEIECGLSDAVGKLKVTDIEEDNHKSEARPDEDQT